MKLNNKILRITCMHEGSWKEPMIIYTDGACSVHSPQQPGGWAWVKLNDGKMTCACGGEYHTTNNKMELTGAIKALKSTKKGMEIILYTDSKYVSDGMSQWITKWMKKGWKNSSGKTVKNLSLWKDIYALALDRTVIWKWVKAHDVNDWNNLADFLAVKGKEDLKDD